MVNAAAPTLRRWERSVYGMPYLGYSIATIPIIAFVPSFYASERGIELGLVGILIALTRVTDAFTDPMVGWMSDRLRTPIGRRKPVIMVGLPVLCLSAWMLFVPPEQVDPAYLFLWSALLYLGFTLVDLPFKSFGAELSPNYDERAELAGWREGFGLVGMLMGLAAATAVTSGGSNELGAQLKVLAIIAVMSTPILFAITLFVLREPQPRERRSSSQSAFQRARLIWSNRPFRLLLIVSFVTLSSELGASALKALILEQVYAQKELFPVLLLFEVIFMVASIPFWLWLSSRFSKHRVVAAATLFGAVMSILLFSVAGNSVQVFMLLSVLKAGSLGAITVLLNGMAADVIDVDEARTGEVRTGTYFALWGMMNKGAAAFGVLLATNIPTWLGYEFVNGVSRAEETLLWIYSIAPAVGFLIVTPLLWTWPLTRETQLNLRTQIAGYDPANHS